ncbi:hypothetical protein RhiirA5_463964, partial [Rhizophagus irregularis]
IRVLGVPQTGAKSRVETQIKLCLQLVTDKGEKVPLWSHLRLPEYMVAKEKLKTKNARNPPDHAMNISEKGVLNLEATVVCASDIPKKVLTCLGCVQRERKRSQRKKENKNAKVNSSTAPSADDTNKPMDLDDEKTMQLEQRKILLFNCSEIVDFSSGDTILPTRITCYCRHHNEKVGFCIYFVMKDYTNTVIANGMSPPIMITDDHKSSKTKIGVGRKRPRAEYDRPMRLHHNPNSMMRRAFYNTSGNSIYQNGTISGYPLPRISRLIPSEGPTYGGVEVTILGSNFIEGLTCVFGETPALPTQYWSPNTLVCVLPPAPTPGPVVVSFKECPLTLMDNSEEVVFFTYTDDSDRALMELALQVVGMKMTGKLEDARNIAMRIVGGNDNNNNNSASLALQTGENNFEAHIITTIGLLDVLETEHNSISLQNRQQHTMLHIAAMLGYTRLCSVLIDKGIDLNLQDKYGFTALHYAAWTGKDDVVRLLMRG